MMRTKALILVLLAFALIWLPNQKQNYSHSQELPIQIFNFDTVEIDVDLNDLGIK